MTQSQVRQPAIIATLLRFVAEQCCFLYIELTDCVTVNCKPLFIMNLDNKPKGFQKSCTHEQLLLYDTAVIESLLGLSVYYK